MTTKNILNSLSLMRPPKLNYAIRAVLVMLLFTLGIGNAWAGKAQVRAKSADAAQGLVYAAKDKPSSVALSNYVEYCPSSSTWIVAGTNSGPHNCYFYAKAVRGKKFKAWSGFPDKTTGSLNGGVDINNGPWTGNGDNIQQTAGGGQSTETVVTATFEAATSYSITYAVPVGGSYSISYKYLTINSSKKFAEKTDNYSMTSSSDAKVETSYADDVVTLSTSETNFVGWYEGTTQKSTAKSYTYPITKAATVTALFKLASLGTATGDLSPAVNAGKASELTSFNGTITVPVSAHGSWAAGDFTVTFTEKTSRGDIAKGTVTYAKSTGNDLGSTGTLTIPFTFSPASFGGTEVEVTVTPAYGEAKTFTILASANKVLNYEACILLGDETEPQDENTGTLAEMVTLANTLDSKPKVQLAKNCAITSPLSLTKSMTFDLNDKIITSSGASAFSIAAQGIDVQIVDNGFSQLGAISVSSAQSGNVCVVGFTQKAKLTMQGGTLSATNTGSGSAYGINVTQGSTFYMTNGQLTVTAASGSAEGVHVATASDYATLNGGSITVTAPTQAYGVWSAGQSNITGATIAAETTTGANAYGVYVNGGVSTLTANTVAATAKTTGAYAAYVNAGRLNGNGGSFAAEAVTSGVYGVHVQAGAEAMLQMNAVVTAEATGANGTSVFGVNNLGAVSLTNVSVTATSPTTAATAVNTATSATSTTIEGGTYRANTTGGTAYGLHHQYGALTVDGGEFKAVGGGNTIYGGRSTVNATIDNASIWGETQGSGNTAYGFVGATEGKNITLTNCAITGLSVTSKAYAIYSRANVTATNCDLTATTTNAGEAYGLYAEKGTNALTNCDATVTSNTTTAYGVNHVAGTLTIDGGQFDVTASQSTAGAEQSTYAYGIYNAASQTTNVNNAIFNVKASNNAYSKEVYGAYAKGILNSTNTTFNVEGRTIVRGVYAESTLTLSGNTIKAEAKNGGDCYGVYAKKGFTFDGTAVRATATTTNVYALVFDANTSEGTIADGKYYAMGNGTTAFAPLNASATVGKVKIQGGVYSTIVNIDKYLVSGYNVYNLDNEHPDFATGHRFIVADENPTPYVCYIKGGNKYTSLEAAMQYTKDNSGSNYTIIMTQDYTLLEGDYELPSNATLLVPRNADQTSINGATPARRTTKSITVENLRLTLASGAHINVNGKIEVGGEMYCAETGQISHVCSEYGRIHMEEGSLIQLNSGAVLYAWGYITGKGEIKAKNNAEVHEMFQIGDMKSMSNIGSGYYNNSQKFFFINQYYIQNIEVPTTYYYNSRLVSAMASYYNYKFMGDDDVRLVGTSGALFLVTSNDESSWVRKTYDAVNDYQIWEVNSSAQLGSMTIEFQEGVPIIESATFNSANYYLPITNNMKIHVLDGDFAITQTSELLPGASVEVDKTASLTINSGKTIYIFDNDQWPFDIKQVTFSPSWSNGKAPTRTKVDAALNVHGKIVVDGSFYTSNSIASGTNATNGANIFSNNTDAGTISYGVNAPSSTSSINLITSITGTAYSPTRNTRAVTMESAKLKNNDDSYTATAGTQSGEAWIYLNNVWQKTYTNGCFEVIGSTVYAKPSGYVALKKNQTVGGKLTGVEETNHTYLTADDKILILMDECQWWEVEATSDPTVFECKKTGYEGFYYYDNTTSKWELKTVDVKFYKNETGETILKTITTSYNGIPDQAVIATNPTKATTAEFTYSFYGWKSSVTGTEYKWTDPLEVATADMSYRPVFTKTKRNYTITLVNANNGANVPLEVPYGAKPSYEPIKDADAQYTYTFEGWSPAFTTVTGTATYTATWSSVVNEYNITWKNGETVLEVDENQPYGTPTAYNGATPTKAADDEFAYTFSGWHNSITNAPKANNETVTGAIIYTAQYNTTPRYAVTFNNYDGVQLDRIIYTQGETPAYDGVPTRKRDDNGYFKFIGWKNSNGTDYAANATLPTVTKKETYTAQYEYVTDLFTITLKNVDGNGAEWSGKFGEGAIPFYNPNDDDVPVTPAKEGNAQYSYPFSGWEPALVPVTGAATYTAKFTQTLNKYTITWKNNDGSTLKTEDVAYGATPVYDGTPTQKPTISHVFSFRAWTPEISSVTGDATYTADYTASPRPYPVQWVNYDGKVLKEETRNYGWDAPAATAYDGERPIREGSNGKIYTFAGWSDPVSEEEGCDVTYTALYRVEIVVDDQTSSSDNPVVVEEDTEVTTTTVKVKGALRVENNYTLTTDDLILEATPSSSGEITGAGTVKATRALFDFSQPDGFKARTWYAVAVPWQVDVPWNAGYSQTCGISAKRGSGDFTPLALGREIDLIYYDGAKRAEQGHSDACWKYVEDDGQSEVMKPGRAYMFYLSQDADLLRFERKEGADLHTNTTSVTAYLSDNAKNANWNGIANPATFKAYLNANAYDATYGPNYGQLYNAEDKAYTAINLNNTSLLVGQPVFVQATADNASVVASPTQGGAFSAPRRTLMDTHSVSHELVIRTNERVCDRIIIRAEEDKDDRYIIGLDLNKADVSQRIAQMWIDRYDAQLCVNTMEPVNNETTYPLGLYAPQAGEYTIALDADENTSDALYLTYNNTPIWNLSYAPYILSMEKGQTVGYGLKLVRSNAPAVATGIDEAVVDAQGEPRKVLVDNQVFIIRGNNVYTIDGQLVK